MGDGDGAVPTEQYHILRVVLQPQVLFTLGIGLCLYFLLRRNPRVNRYMSRIPGPQGLPIFGSALACLRPHKDYFDIPAKLRDEYGPIYKLWIGNFLPYVFLCNAHLAEKVLSTSVHIEKGKYDYSVLHKWLGFGLLTAPGVKWFPRRKLLTPTFHFKILEEFMPIFNEQAEVLVNCLQTEIQSNKPFDIAPYISKCTLDIICETAMGKRMNAQTSSVNKEYIDAVYGMCELLTTKVFGPWYRIPLIYHLSPLSKRENEALGILKGFCDEVIQGKVAERERVLSSGSNSSGKRKAFLDLLLDCVENGERMSGVDIRDEVNTFMFEGHDTTSVNLQWTLLMLSYHPECQKLVHDELDRIFGEHPGRDVTTGDLSKMKYLECVIKESLRLYPSVPAIMRQIETDIALGDGKLIPAGATAMISIQLILRDPTHFEEPDHFNPERFTLENSAGRHPYAYIPFSAGSRNCIGQRFALMEEKVVLAKLLRKFSVEEGASRVKVFPVPEFVLRPKGMKVKLKMRKN